MTNARPQVSTLRSAKKFPPPEVFKEMEALVKQAQKLDAVLSVQMQFMWEHRAGLHTSGDPGGRASCWACRADPKWNSDEVIKELMEAGWTP